MASAREVLLVTHVGRSQAVDAACRLARGLVDAGLRVRVPSDELTRLHEGANGGADLPLAPTDDTGLPPQCELVVVVGGDGTILRAAEYAVPAGIPLLGVNLGHVGFLAEVESDDVPDVVASVVNRAYAVEERLALAVRVLRDGHEVWSTWALNEATVEKASRQKMIDVLLEIEGHPLSRWGCDGVVVATPTGSTAYAWSIGGPVVWPGVQAMLVAPISAHALFARSLVVDPKNTVAVDLQRTSAEAVLWCDGRRVKHLLPGARVQVTSGDAPIRFARLHRSDFTDRLVAKFHLPVDGWRGDARVIANLNISGLGVIATADLEFSAGLVAFTGETGAGKTMVVTAMGLVLGDRADTGVSAGSDRVDVDAVIVVPTDGPAAQQIEAAGAVLDPDGSVVVTRSLSSQTRGRATLGGTAVPVAALHEFGERVAQRHSQSDQILLRKPRRQRISLDQYGGAAVAAAVRRYRERYDEFLALTRRLNDLTADVGRRHARIAELREGLAEIEAVDPQVGEEQTLPDTILRLTNAESLRLAAGDALRWLSADDQEAVDAAVAMERGVTALQRVTGQDPGLVSVAERLGSAAEIVSEIAGELRRYTAVLHADPEALEQLHQRKAALALLQRKYGDTGAEIRSWAEAAHAELAELDVDDDAVQALRAELTTVVTVLGQAAAALSEARSAAATGLSAAVSRELRALSMPKAEFVVEVIQRDDPAGLRLPDGRACAFGENGVDVVRFLLAPHPGSVPSPIGDGASGGELSRIMLALEVVLAEHSPPSVFVFDEIDAGIGGRTATEVGRRLARLANRSQVFVVTHLAQVASFADQHIVVEKDQSGRVTAASVHEVAGDGRTTELSRMLSGQDQSPAARQHARELLELAAADRSPEAG